MAIVKASFTRSKAGAKASIRYIQHRPGKEGERATRTLFGSDGLMGRFEAYRMIEEAEERSHFFRLVVSPDPQSEDTRQDLSLRFITQHTMQTLEDRLHQQIDWVGVVHADHAPHRHVHLVAVVRGRLGVADLQALRQAATQASFQQRQERDQGQEQLTKMLMGTGIVGRLLLFLTLVYHRLHGLFTTDARLHQARFSRIDELHPLLRQSSAADGLLLGSKPGRHLVSVLPTQTRRELGNLLIVGPTRSGKGLLATSQLLSWHHSVIVNDIKGELFTQTADYRAMLGPVYVIDPTGVGHSFDPLLNKQTEDELYSSASQLLFKPDECEGAIFTQRAIGMLTQLFLASRREGVPPLPYVRHLIRLGLSGAARRLNQVNPDLATQLLDVHFNEANLSDRFLLSSWGTLTARLRPLLTETVVRCFTRSDFTAQQVMCSEKPVTVYLRWPERDLLALSPLVRLLWGTLIDELITSFDQQQGRGCHPVLLLIDEAGRTAIPSLADHATTVVGRGVSLWIAVQSLSQLETVYGKARSQVLRDNMESQLYYRPTDLATASYLEKRLGDTSAYAHSTTSRDGGAASEGLAERPIPLLTAQEILQLPDTEVIGFHRHLPPFRLTRMDWRHVPRLSQRRTLHAPELLPLPALAAMPHQNPERSAPTLIDPDRIYQEAKQTGDRLN